MEIDGGYGCVMCNKESTNHVRITMGRGREEREKTVLLDQHEAKLFRVS